MKDALIPMQGLSATQAAHALAEHGPNALPEAKPVTVLQRLVRQFRNPLSTSFRSRR